MELILVTENNYKKAIEIQNDIFPNENGTLNILASLDRNLFIKITGMNYIDDHIKYYLAMVDNNYVGITGLYYYDYAKDSAWIGWYGILKKYRKQGLGKELLDKTISLGASQGFKSIRLYTDIVENHEAIKLYEAMGFIKEKYTAEKLEYECYIYSKSLTNNPIILWDNKFLSLSHQSELDHADEKQIKKIMNLYNKILEKVN